MTTDLSTSSSMAFYDRHELTCYLTVDERALLESKISTVTEASIEALSASLKGLSPFQGEFWGGRSYKEWPLIALAAFKMGKCSEAQFATISLFWAALKEFVRTKTSYVAGFQTNFTWTSFHEEALSTDPIKFFFPASPKYDKYLGVIFNREIPSLSTVRDEIEKFKSMADRCLFVIKMPSRPLEYWAPMMKAIKKATYKRVYPFVEKNVDLLGFTRKRKLVLPSFPILELLSKCRDLQMQIKMIPRLGAMTERDIAADRMRFSHVVALGMEEIPLPTRADERPTGPFTFGFHDIYHTETYASCLTRELFTATNRMIQVLYSLPDHPALTMLRGRLIDAEFMNGISSSGYMVGHLFSNPYLAEVWEFQEGAYKKVILEDMAKHQPLWDYICRGGIGLSMKDRNLVPPHPNPTFPPTEELLPLVLGREVTENQKRYVEKARALIHDYPYFNERFTRFVQHIAGEPYEQLWLNLDSWKKELVESPHFELPFTRLTSYDIIYTFRDLKGGDEFEALLSLLSTGHDKEIAKGSFSAKDLIMILNESPKAQFRAFLELTEAFNLSKQEMVSVLRKFKIPLRFFNVYKHQLPPDWFKHLSYFHFNEDRESECYSTKAADGKIYFIGKLSDVKRTLLGNVFTVLLKTDDSQLFDYIAELEEDNLPSQEELLEAIKEKTSDLRSFFETLPSKKKRT